MKVVLFCGGLGMRMSEYPENVPKPMVPLGYRPIIWHVMRYYAHHGHNEFILCLGYRGDAIKQFFLNYEECLSNDFVFSQGGRKTELLRSDIEDWRITFVETGLNSSIGERLMAVRRFLKNDEAFLANYADGVTDLPLDDYVDRARERGNVATFLAVRPNLSYHFIEMNGHGRVTAVKDMSQSGLRVNGGYFYFRREIFDYMEPGDDLVAAPFERLMADGELVAYPYDGFWAPMDTAKDKQRLDELQETGRPPWYVWSGNGEANGGGG